MNEKRSAQGEQIVDVLSAMYGEDCIDCFGCPEATRMAAVLVRRDRLFWKADARPDTTINALENLAEAVEETKAELRVLTEDCVGYSDIWTPSFPRPAQMCNSPEIEYERMELVAGRIAEVLRWLFPRK